MEEKLKKFSDDFKMKAVKLADDLQDDEAAAKQLGLKPISIWIFRREIKTRKVKE